MPVYNNILDYVARITSERDKKSLATVLVNTIIEMTDIDSAALLNIPFNFKDNILEIEAIAPIDFYQDKEMLSTDAAVVPALKADRLLSQSIDNKKIVTEQQHENTRIAYPIICNNILVAVLDTYQKTDSEETRKMLIVILKIYSNFLAVINESERDSLTGLYNRRTFDKHVIELTNSDAGNQSQHRHTGKERRHKKQATKNNYLAIMDIDYFKRVNDKFGHIYGDEVLIIFANYLRNNFRNSDIIFRFGGEEFVVILSNISEEDAFASLERFRNIIEAHQFPQIGTITVSSGMTLLETNIHISTLIDHADKALYYAKENGRNQIAYYNALVATGKISERVVETDIELF